MNIISTTTRTPKPIVTQGIMYPNYENCATFLDEEITPEDFMTGLDKYKETHKEQEKQAQAKLLDI